MKRYAWIAVAALAPFAGCANGVVDPVDLGAAEQQGGPHDASDAGATVTQDAYSPGYGGSSGSSGSSSSSSGSSSSSSGSSSSSSGSSSGSSGSSSGSSGSSSGSSGSSSGSSGSSSGSSGSSSGSSGGSTCGALVDPNTPANCTACLSGGHTCQANGCFGGYWCNTTTNGCHAPPTTCP